MQGLWPHLSYRDYALVGRTFDLWCRGARASAHRVRCAVCTEQLGSRELLEIHIQRLSENSARPQTGALRVGNERQKALSLDVVHHPRRSVEKPSGYFSDSLSRLDFSHSRAKGVGYARHRNPQKEVIEVRTLPTVMRYGFWSRSRHCSPNASGSTLRCSWRALFRSSGQKNCKFRPARNGLRPGEALPSLPPGA